MVGSRGENFCLSKAYANKIDVINVITAPEIEMLIIFNEGEFKHFCNSKLMPSEFCKRILHIQNVKSYDFVYDYFSDSYKLVNAINEYHKNKKS